MFISTFASTKSELITAIEAGAHHIILEDSKLSTRSTSDDFSNIGFNKVLQLANLARSTKHNIHLSFNIDILGHNNHFEIIENAIETLKKAKITTIRIQDPGLYLFIKEKYPEAQLHLNTETNNNNIESIKHYANDFISQTLSPALTLQELKEITASLPNYPFELQVHGNLLGQLSHRRYLNSLENTQEAVKQSHFIDEDHPDKTFKIKDTPHGSAITLFQQKCLIEYIPDIISLSLFSWLIDLRNEKEKSLMHAIQIYKQAYEAHITKESFNSEEHLKTLQSQSSRPLSPCFFSKNTTDLNYKTTQNPFHNNPNHTYIGHVLDCNRPKDITIETTTPLRPKTPLTFFNPEGRTITHTLENIYSLNNQPLSPDHEETIVKMAWIKGIIPKTLIYNKSEKQAQPPINSCVFIFYLLVVFIK
jgi:collagenase-like PrtC family protease